MDVGREDTVHFAGVFGGEIQSGCPEAQPLQILLPVQPGKLFAVKQHRAAAVAVLDHREFGTGLIDQLHRCPVADAFSGPVIIQAVLRDHQRKTSVDQQFAGDGLGHIPDLGHGHFKAQCGAGKLQLPGHIHGTGIVHIQTEVTPDPQPQLPDGDQMAQVTDQNIRQAQLLQPHQRCPDPAHLLVTDDPGQHRCHFAPLQQLLSQFRIAVQNMQRHIEHHRFQFQHFLGQLLLACDLDAQSRHTLRAGNLGKFPGTEHLGLLPAAPDGSKLIQHIPAHGVDGCCRKDQSRLHLGPDFHAPVGGSSGLGKPLGQRSTFQLHRPGNLRHRACHPAGIAGFVGNRQGTSRSGDHCPEFHIHQGVLHTFIALAHFLEPLGGNLLFLPNTEHLGTGLAFVIVIGKALAVEGLFQLIHHNGTYMALIDGPAVYIRHRGHIFRPLHTAFQLQRCHAQGFQLLDVVYQAVVLQAQRVLVFPVTVAIALAAGLGAAAPVAGAAADDGGHIALAGIAHAQRTVAKDFNLDGGFCADFRNLIPAQFPAQNHPAHPPGGTKLHAGKGVDGHLGGAVDGHGGCDLTAQLDDTQILDDEGVHACDGGMTDQLAQLFHLPVGYQGI